MGFINKSVEVNIVPQKNIWILIFLENLFLNRNINELNITNNCEYPIMVASSPLGP
jgi:hypothetical protein